MSIDARAVLITSSGGPEVLSIGNVAVRDPGYGEVRIKVAAAGLNRADVMQRKGFYPAPPGVHPDIPGLEYAGVVEAVGEGVTLHEVGDRVMGIVAGGGMAEALVVHAREAMKVPDGLSNEEAAAVPEVFLTAYDAIVTQAESLAGETLLLHAIGSGIGTAGAQLARLFGMRVIGTARSAEKIERAREYGMNEGVVVGDDGAFADAVLAHNGGRGADVIFDGIGARYLGENLQAIAPLGRIVVIGLLGGAMGDLNLGLLLHRRARVIGSVLRARPLEEKIALAQTFGRTMVPRFADKTLRPVVDAVLPMADIGEAHARMERNETFGKLVMAW